MNNHVLFSLRFCFFLLLLTNFSLFAQNCHLEGTVFINEIGNFAGDGEYVELVVVGSTANPTAPVNLEGYIVDDNNFPDINIGNEPGHLRLGSCFRAVPPGTIILIYGGSAAPPGINPNSNGTSGSVWQTSNGSCIIGVEGVPNHSSGSYEGGTIMPVATTKDFIPQRNWGDVIQVRTPGGELVHAISWTPGYEYNGDAKVVQTGILDMGDKAFSMTADAEWFDAAHFQASGSGSPGAPNSVLNAKLIQELKNGSFRRQLEIIYTVKRHATARRDGQVEVTIKGGTPPFYIGLSSIKFTTQSHYAANGTYLIENLPAASYNVTVNDINDCGDLFTLEIKKSIPICAGQCKEIGVNPDEYCYVKWVHNGSTNPKQLVCPAETQTFELGVINNKGDFESLFFTVEVAEAIIQPNPTLICPNQSKTLLAMGNNQSYSWSTGATTASIQVSAKGKYTVTVVDETGCTKKGTAVVYSALNPEEIKQYFLAMGFSANYDVTVLSYPGKPSNNSAEKNTNTCFNDFSNDELLSNGEIVDVEGFLESACELENYAKSWLTDNDAFCKDGVIENIESNFMSSDKNLWIHLFRFGNESILFFRDNRNFGSNSLDDLSYPLDKSTFQQFVNTLCPPNPFPNDPNGHNHYGRKFEHLWHTFAHQNFNRDDVFFYYTPNSLLNPTQLFSCNINYTNTSFSFPKRTTEPDGLAYKVCAFNNKNVWKFIFCAAGALQDGRVLYEVKALNEATNIEMSYKNYQIPNHINNLRCNFPNYVGSYVQRAHLVMVTTSGVTVSSNIINFANGDPVFTTSLAKRFPQWVGFNQYEAVYWRDSQNNIKISFFPVITVNLQQLLRGQIRIDFKALKSIPFSCF